MILCDYLYEINYFYNVDFGGRKPLDDLSTSVKSIDVLDEKKVINGAFNNVYPSWSHTSKLLKFKNNSAILNKEIISAKGEKYLKR